MGKGGSSSIQRSVETGMAVEYPRGGSSMNRQASRESTDGSMNSYSSEGKYVRRSKLTAVWIDIQSFGFTGLPSATAPLGLQCSFTDVSILK